LAAKNAIDRAPHGSILVFGDNMEGAPPLPTICGHAVVNGGVSGATIGYFERRGRTTRIYPSQIDRARRRNQPYARLAVYRFQSHTTRSSRRFRACRRGGRNGYAGAEWNGGGRLSSGPGPNLRHRHPCNTRDGLGHRSQRTALALTSPRTESIGIAHTLGGAASIPSGPSNPSN
jgi:hypothetical protein